MPLSPNIYSACTAVNERLTNLQTSSDYILTRDNDNNNDLQFFSNFIKNALACNDDLEFINQLLTVVQDFQGEHRTISSLAVVNAIRYFIETLKKEPSGPIIEKNLNKIINPEAATRKVKLDPHIKQYIEKCRITLSSYLNQLDIQSEGLDTNIKKFTSSFLHIFRSSSKIIKSVDNPKVILAKKLDADLALLLTDGKYMIQNEGEGIEFHDLPLNPDKKSIIEIIKRIFTDRIKQANIEVDNNNFFNILKLILNDIESELSTDKTLKQVGPAITEQISNALTSQLQAYKKTLRRLEPANIVHSSNLKHILHAAIGASQTLGGEDERIVITSVRQNVNPSLHELYAAKKQELMHNKNMKCPYLEPLIIECEESSLNPNVNEMILLHGTSVQASVNIFETGFRKPSDKSYLSIAGPLGTGIYMSDHLAKSGTFSTCVLCGLVTCSCKIAPEQKVEHCLIISKVIMGNIHSTLEKREHIPADCHTRVGIGKHKNPKSEFNSTEICIPDSNTHSTLI